MADEELQDQEQQQAAIDVARGDGGGNKTVIIMIVLSVFVMVLTPIITVFAVQNFMPKVEKQTQASKGNLYTVPLTGITVNVKNTNASHFLSCDIVIEFTKKDMELLFQPKTTENPTGFLYKIKSEINQVLSSKTMTELDQDGIQESLAKDLKSKLINLLGDKAGDGTITEVVFSKFLVQ